MNKTSQIESIKTTLYSKATERHQYEINAYKEQCMDYEHEAIIRLVMTASIFSLSFVNWRHYSPIKSVMFASGMLFEATYEAFSKYEETRIQAAKLFLETNPYTQPIDNYLKLLQKSSEYCVEQAYQNVNPIKQFQLCKDIGLSGILETMLQDSIECI